jgi:hypothetical protein
MIIPGFSHRRIGSFSLHEQHMGVKPTVTGITHRGEPSCSVFASRRHRSNVMKSVGFRLRVSGIVLRRRVHGRERRDLIHTVLFAT